MGRIDKERSLRIKEYIRGYRTLPESTEEIEASHRISEMLLAEEPWK